ncbi:hypothetical protein OAM67_01695, partial [bacterium]|nr:hypothetical protein [bacterium]
MVMGVTNGSKLFATQVCQHTGGANEPRFAAVIPPQILDADFSFKDNVAYDGGKPQTVKEVGQLIGDQWCARAMGFRPKAVKIKDTTTDGMRTITIVSNVQKSSANMEETVVMPFDVAAAGSVGALAKDEVVKFKFVGQGPNPYMAELVREGDGLQYFAQNKTVGEYGRQPIGACYVSGPDAFDYKCESGVNVVNCWTPELCEAQEGYWNNGNDCGADEECYAGGGYCSREQPCSRGSCSTCDSGNCEAVGCAIIPGTSACGDPCDPESGQCETCGLDSCNGNCTMQGGRCTFGPNLCKEDAPTENEECSAIEGFQHNLVYIPSNFLTANQSTSGCLPAVFEPSPGGVHGFTADETASSSAHIRSCAEDDPALGNSAVPNFEVDCAKDGSNCYSFDQNVCGSKNYFKTYSINNTASCYFENDDVKQILDTASAAPELFAARWQESFDTWESFQAEDTSSKTLWYMINRIFSWTLMYSTSRKSNFSLLGLSTLMNAYGVDKSTGQPFAPFNGMDDLDIQAQNNTQWYEGQPLLFEKLTEKGQGDEYFFTTLQDIHKFSKDPNNTTHYLYGVWKDEYISQLNMFVYSAEDDSKQWRTTSPLSIAQYGLVGSSDPNTATSTAASLNAMMEYSGTLYGSMGTCHTIFHNDYFVYSAYGAAGLIIVILIIYWIVRAVRSRHSSTASGAPVARVV